MGNKKLFWGVLVVIVVILIVWVARNKSSTPTETIKIGVIAPLTGPASVFGNSLVKGIQMSLADLKGAKHNYELVIEDDTSNPANSASAAHKLVDIDKVSAIISATSGTGNAIAPIADAAHVPQICVRCADKKIGYGAYNYIYAVLPEDDAAGWYKEAVARGVKSVAFLSQVHPGINAIMDEMEKQAALFGIQVVYKERFDGENRDFSTIIAKSKLAKPDMYFLISFPPSLDIIGKEMATLGLKNFSSAGGAFSIAAEPELFNGLWFTDTKLSDESFRARFESAYPDVRFNYGTAPGGYDVFNLLVKAFEGGQDIAAALAGTHEYSGKVQVTKASDNYFRIATGAYTMEDGRAVLNK